MELPSKELLTEVLGKNVKMVITDIKVIHSQLNSSVKNSEIAISYDDKWTYENIYELMHLMKEWAFSNDYQLYSGRLIGHKSICSVVNFDNSFAETEFEAVIKACEWILSQKESK